MDSILKEYDLNEFKLNKLTGEGIEETIKQMNEKEKKVPQLKNSKNEKCVIV